MAEKFDATVENVPCNSNTGRDADRQRGSFVPAIPTDGKSAVAVEVPAVEVPVVEVLVGEALVGEALVGEGTAEEATDSAVSESVVTGPDVTESDGLETEVTGSAVAESDVPVSDAPVSDCSAPDVPVPDVTVSDVTVSDCTGSDRLEPRLSLDRPVDESALAMVVGVGVRIGDAVDSTVLVHPTQTEAATSRIDSGPNNVRNRVATIRPA